MRLSKLIVLSAVVCICERSMAGDHVGYHFCDSLAQCGSLGAAAYKRGDYVRAKDYFEQEVGQYEQSNRPCNQDGHTCPHAAVPYNNVALALLKSGQPLKAQAWLDIAPPDDPATEHNRRLVRRALKGWAWPPGLEGEYWQYAGYGSWSTVNVSRDGNKWSIDYLGLRFPGSGMEFGPNFGELSTDMALDARTTIYSEDDGCKVSFTFFSESVVLNEDDSKRECEGFGNGVLARGTFQRVSIRPVKVKP